MKKLGSKENSTIIGGNRYDRINRQHDKCILGSMRACRRRNRMLDRMFN